MAMLVGIGLGDRTRTCGLTLPKRELYQLSYTQFGRSREGNVFHNGPEYTQNLERVVGIEPNSTQFGKLVSHLGLTRNWLLVHGTFTSVVLHAMCMAFQIPNSTNTTEDFS